MSEIYLKHRNKDTGLPESLIDFKDIDYGSYYWVVRKLTGKIYLIFIDFDNSLVVFWDDDKYRLDSFYEEFAFLQKISDYSEYIGYGVKEIADLLGELDCQQYGCDTCESVIGEVMGEIKRLKLKCGELID